MIRCRRMALQSDDMNLALDKMQLFVADFMVQWKQVDPLAYRTTVKHGRSTVNFSDSSLNSHGGANGSQTG